MEAKIQSIHFDASEQLQSFIQKKIGKLEKFYDDIKRIEVILKVEKSETVDNKEALIKVFVPGMDFFASKTCDTFEEAVDDSIEAMKNQLTKHKEKLQLK